MCLTLQSTNNSVTPYITVYFDEATVNKSSAFSESEISLPWLLVRI